MAKKKEIKEEPILIKLEEVLEPVETANALDIEELTEENLLDSEDLNKEPIELELNEDKKTAAKRNNKVSVEVEFLEDSLYFKKGDKSFTSSLNAQQLVNLKKAKIV